LLSFTVSLSGGENEKGIFFPGTSPEAKEKVSAVSVPQKRKLGEKEEENQLDGTITPFQFISKEKT